MVILPSRRPELAPASTPLTLLQGCSSLVYPASDADDKSSSSCITSLSPKSSSPLSISPSPSFSSPSPISGSPLKPHKCNDGAWETVQCLKSVDGSIDLNQFKLIRRIGEGDIGSVFLVRLPGTSYNFAIKVMDKTHLKSRNKLHRVQTEREILELLDHPFLPTLYGWYDTVDYACLLMEFCPGGDLHKLRQRQPAKRFDEDAVRFYAAEVILALEYLHMMGVVYRDLKPENVLVREDGHIMLTDFDLALRFDASPSLLKPQKQFRASCIAPNSQSCATAPIFSCTPGMPTNLLRRHDSLPSKKKLQESRDLRRTVSSLPQLNVEPLHLRSMSFVGTHEYLAPEIIAGGGHGSAVDWWTLGIFIYELLFGQTPFKGENNDATLMNAFTKPLQFPAGVEASQSAKELVKSLIVKDPRRRLGSARGAADLKMHPFFEDINWALIRCSIPPQVPKRVSTDMAATKDVEPSIKPENLTFECF